MSVLNTWTPLGKGEREAVVQCDFCLPPRHGFGRPTGPVFRRWTFESFYAGPHRCPWCAGTARQRRVDLRGRTRRPALPTFVIVGAAKAGTSALHHYLRQHPQVFMPAIKELKFFQDPDCLEELDSYAACFEASSPARGEATPIYSCHPLLPGIPARIREAIPDAKLIYLVRDPVERAIATYVEAVVGEIEPRSIDEAFRHPEDPYNVYTAQSRYATQYEQFARSFPAEQILVIDQADLYAHRRATLKRVFRFVGVDPDFWSPGFDQMVNTRSGKRRRTALGRLLRTTPLAHAIKRLPPESRDRVLAPVRRLTSERIIQPDVSAELRARLAAALHQEASRLEELTGMRLEARPPLVGGVGA